MARSVDNKTHTGCTTTYGVRKFVYLNSFCCRQLLRLSWPHYAAWKFSWQNLPPRQLAKLKTAEYPRFWTAVIAGLPAGSPRVCLPADLPAGNRATRHFESDRLHEERGEIAPHVRNQEEREDTKFPTEKTSANVTSHLRNPFYGRRPNIRVAFQTATAGGEASGRRKMKFLPVNAKMVHR